jgi:hypothetical protein
MTGTMAQSTPEYPLNGAFITLISEFQKKVTEQQNKILMQV